MKFGRWLRSWEVLVIGAAVLWAAPSCSASQTCGEGLGKCVCEAPSDCVDHYPETACSVPTCSEAGVCGRGLIPAGTPCDENGGTCDGVGECIDGAGGSGGNGGAGGGGGGSQPTRALSIDAGRDFTCAVTTSGLACWGVNGQGQLGDGTTQGKLLPVLTIATDDVSSVSAGESHTCAVRNSSLYCWGENAAGQLGFAGEAQNQPQLVAALAGATTVSAGGTHTCAIGTDAIARCWGANASGQLGNGTTTNSPNPVVVAGMFEFSQVSAGGEHSCGRLASGMVRCWGANSTGQLGNNQSTNSSTPVGALLPTAAFVASASSQTMGGHSCALLATNEVACWGLNNVGQLGRMTPSPVELQVGLVDGESMADSMCCGAAHCCTLRQDGTVWCWGGNDQGQLGDGTEVDRTIPVAAGSDTYSAISCGTRHTCAIDEAGAVFCWGVGSAMGDGIGLQTSVRSQVMLETLAQ